MSSDALPELVSTVLVDLDDTLYPQQMWLDGAWADVATVAAKSAGVDRLHLEHELRRVASEGSDRGRIIDRALEALDRSDVDVQPLVEAFLAHRPLRLTPYPGVPEALEALAREHTVVVVTDGLSHIQRHKIDVLGIERWVDHIVVSDEISRESRKPSPLPLQRAMVLAGSHLSQTVMIGDRPDKDVQASRTAGIACIRVTTGEYAGVDDTPRADVVVDDFPAAVQLVMERRTDGVIRRRTHTGTRSHAD